MHRTMLYKTGVLAVGSYRFIKYTNNSKVVTKVEEESGIV